MKNSLIGAWKLIQFEFRTMDDRIIHPFGKEAAGIIIYSESGYYSAQLMSRERPRFAIPDQMKGTPEEIDVNYKGCISYFGTYEVDEEKHIIAHHVEGSLFPNMNGTLQKRTFELDSDHLQLTTPRIYLDGLPAIGILLWRKI